METKEIIEGNQLIAEFMSTEPTLMDGWYLWSDGIYFSVRDQDKGKVLNSIYGYVKYHSSWDWLMPVVEKIGEIRFPDDKYESGERIYIERCYPITFGMKDEEEKFMVRLLGNQLFRADTLIKATWLSVVDFIKWHNKNKP